MDDDKYKRSVSLLCPTCASDQFEYEDEEGPIKCASCDRQFTMEELIDHNGEKIESEVEEIGADVLKDITKDLGNSLKKAFRGNKSIRFK